MAAREKFSYDSLVSTNYVTGRVNESGSRLKLVLEWEDEPKIESLALPRYFSSLSELESRKLVVQWGNGASSKTTYSSMLVGLDTYITLRFPGFYGLTPIKLYPERPHNSDNDEYAGYGFIPVYGLLTEIESETRKLSLGSRSTWDGAVSNVVMIAPSPERFHKGDSLPLLLGSEPITRTLIFPVIDFDLDSSGNPERDLHDVAEVLKINGFSGYLIKSGDGHTGGYQYLADFMMPYSPYMWQTIGHFMQLFTDPSRLDLARISQNIQQALTWEDAWAAIKDLGPDPNQMEHRSYPISSIDWGWCFHQIREQMCKFRTTKGKGYLEVPQVIGQIL